MYLTETDKYEIGFEVAERAPALLAYWDKNLICRFANSAYLDWLGKTPEKIINKVTLKQLLGPHYENTLPYIQEALKGNVQVFERLIISPAGKTINALVTYSPHIENSQLSGFYVHATDITVLKKKIDVVEAIDDRPPSSPGYLLEVDKTLRSSLLTGFPGIAELSRRHFVSESKLKRTFKETYGTTIFSYYRDLQMEYADNYFSENKSTKKQMAEMLQFSNPANFSKCYQKYLKENETKKLIEKIRKDSYNRHKTFVAQSPFAFAMFDKDMRFLAASEAWRKYYDFEDEKFIGESLYDIYPDVSDKWKLIHSECINKNISQSDESLVRRLNGSWVWIKWDMRPWHNEKNEVAGLMIFVDDITGKKKQEDENKLILEILNKTNEIARIGAWSRNFRTNTGTWNKILREIIEVDENYEPELATTINFYKEGYSRDLIKSCIENALNNGVAFDVEAEMITAKGNEKKVRVIGYPEFINGQCEKLMGIFQEITR